MLTTKHLADLQKSGLTAETIELSGCRSLTRKEVEAYLGFDAQSAGYAIPYPGVSVGDRLFEHVRLDTPYQAPGWKKPAKYLSPSGSGNHLYIAPNLDPSVLQNAAIPLIVTEGEKKTLAANQHGFHCIGLSGVWNWTAGKDPETGQRLAIPDLDLVI